MVPLRSRLSSLCFLFPTVSSNDNTHRMSVGQMLAHKDHTHVVATVNKDLFFQLPTKDSTQALVQVCGLLPGNAV